MSVTDNITATSSSPSSTTTADNNNNNNTVVAPQQASTSAPAPSPVQQQQQNKPQKQINHELVSKYGEYYSRIFPAEDICKWLQYGNTAAYLTNREFCLTLPGDIFCRFKTYNNPTELRRALMKDRPEKIDVGAVYQVPAEKRHQTPLVARERELVFDIDMTDYDNIRSCCKGKQICEHCWPWMATAAKIIRTMVRECFGYHIMLPVFSGRRGLHIWVCDEDARKLRDDERNAIVQHMTVVTGGSGNNEFKMNVMYHLQQNALHPSLRRLFGRNCNEGILPSALRSLFFNPNNKNCVFTNSDSADVFRRAVNAVIDQFKEPTAARNKYSNMRNLWNTKSGPMGTVISQQVIMDIMNFGDTTKPHITIEVQLGIMLALLYPRLDEKVSTQTNHLLKLPLCVHPGTGRLCCPLEFDTIDSFHPVNDPPTLDSMLTTMMQSSTGGTEQEEDRIIGKKWMQPLRDCIAACVEEKKANLVNDNEDSAI